MRYAKPPLTFEDQAQILLDRGMAGDKAVMVSRLRVVNYYRLSGYWFPFRQFPNDSFSPGTTFDYVWYRYVFDRRLRLVVMDAVERVEVCLRTSLSYEHAHTFKNPFAYAEDSNALPGLSGSKRARLLESLKEEMNSSRERFAEHFRKKYGTDHQWMPIWMATEMMTFGNILTLFRGSPPKIRQSIAASLGVHDNVLDSWLLTLNTIRNICAHHSRLWNRQLGTKPKIPAKDERWHKPIEVSNERVFGVLTLLKYCLDRIAPQSKWQKRLEHLLSEFPAIPLASMGIPADWRKCPIWR